ncbi:hypothetical protein ATCC90586_004386 [Pythium insidiosum]|nr:hypothetical protein ATCC90586_004386 [Pythium insidiosum]
MMAPTAKLRVCVALVASCVCAASVSVSAAAASSMSSLPAFDIPSFDYASLLQGETPQRLLQALQTDGMVSLKNIPNYAGLRERYLRKAAECAGVKADAVRDPFVSRKLQRQLPAAMIVPICVEGAKNEWCIVEFQGQMIPNDGDDMANVEIGSLWYDDGVPTMRIGNHIVTGKVAKLSKPFAIMEKRALTHDGTRDTEMPLITERERVADASNANASLANGAPEAHRQTEYNIVGIARSRIIFNDREAPLMRLRRRIADILEKIRLLEHHAVELGTLERRLAESSDSPIELARVAVQLERKRATCQALQREVESQCTPRPLGISESSEAVTQDASDNPSTDAPGEPAAAAESKDDSEMHREADRQAARKLLLVIELKEKRRAEESHRRRLPLVEPDEIDMQTLVAVRRAWDMYLAPPHVVGATAIPPHFVVPPTEPTAAWQRFLVERA